MKEKRAQDFQTRVCDECSLSDTRFNARFKYYVLYLFYRIKKLAVQLNAIVEVCGTNEKEKTSSNEKLLLVMLGVVGAEKSAYAQIQRVSSGIAAKSTNCAIKKNTNDRKCQILMIYSISISRKMIEYES